LPVRRICNPEAGTDQRAPRAVDCLLSLLKDGSLQGRDRRIAFLFKRGDGRRSFAWPFGCRCSRQARGVVE
jgi:hypothetical protein